MTDAKQWVTTKVPKDDRDTANDLKPEDATYGDCLVAGARTLSEDDDTVDVYQMGDDEAVKEVELGPGYKEIASHIASGLDADIDPDAIARSVAQQIDYAHIADSVADELEGRMR